MKNLRNYCTIFVTDLYIFCVVIVIVKIHIKQRLETAISSQKCQFPVDKS